jgi:hypothetical protein
MTLAVDLDEWQIKATLEGDVASLSEPGRPRLRPFTQTSIRGFIFTSP